MPTNGENALAANVVNPVKQQVHKGGRPTREQAELQAKTRTRIERRLYAAADRIVGTYIGLAAGQVVRRGRQSYKLQVDPPTTRDAMNRFIPNEAPPPSQVVSIQILSVDGLEIRSKAELSTGSADSSALEIEVVPGSSGKD